MKTKTRAEKPLPKNRPRKRVGSGTMVGLPSELRWTIRRPDVAGYYWVRAPKLSARVSHFYHAHGQHWLTSDYLHLDFAYGKPVEYAGPLPKPPSAETIRQPNKECSQPATR
jgi:hypothetical protein